MQPSQGQKPPARAYGGSVSKQEMSKGPAPSGKGVEKPMYDPTARNTNQRRPIPVRSSTSATAGKDSSNTPGSKPVKIKVPSSQIINSSELNELRSKWSPFFKVQFKLGLAPKQEASQQDPAANESLQDLIARQNAEVDARNRKPEPMFSE